MHRYTYRIDQSDQYAALANGQITDSAQLQV